MVILSRPSARKARCFATQQHEWLDGPDFGERVVSRRHSGVIGMSCISELFLMIGYSASVDGPPRVPPTAAICPSSHRCASKFRLTTIVFVGRNAEGLVGTLSDAQTPRKLQRRFKLSNSPLPTLKSGDCCFCCSQNSDDFEEKCGILRMPQLQLKCGSFGAAPQLTYPHSAGSGGSFFRHSLGSGLRWCALIGPLRLPRDVLMRRMARLRASIPCGPNHS